MKTEVKYGILLPNGELARYTERYNGDDRYACGEYTYRLTDDPHEKTWLVDTIEDVHHTISEEIGWYNSTLECPCWGEFEQNELTPVKIVVKTEIEKLDIKPPFNVEKVLDCRSITRGRAGSYLGRTIPEPETHYVFCCVNYHKEDMEKLIGQIVQFGSWYNRRKLIGVCNVPEEFLEECQTEPRWSEEDGYCTLVLEHIQAL